MYIVNHAHPRGTRLQLHCGTKRMSSWSVASSDTVEEREKDDSADTMKDCDVTTQSSRTAKLNIWDDEEEKDLPHQV